MHKISKRWPIAKSPSMSTRIITFILNFEVSQNLDNLCKARLDLQQFIFRCN